jgi:hypothetical protein
MPKKIKIRKRRHRSRAVTRRASGGCCGRKRCKSRYAGGYRKRINSSKLKNWINGRAKPWTVRGRGFWQDLGRGFKKGFKTVAKIGLPLLSVLQPELAPLAAVGEVGLNAWK